MTTSGQIPIEKHDRPLWVQGAIFYSFITQPTFPMQLIFKMFNLEILSLWEMIVDVLFC